MTSPRKRKHIWITAALAVLTLGCAFAVYQYSEEPAAFSVADGVAGLRNIVRIPGDVASIIGASYR
ncbi:hypothetical protein PQR34_10875 [Paraburkholderia sediminicola]|uniref:hypothetical protein n=1 Tax=Paraburkholderia TaxID=1822464 RepID=UPI0038B830FE